MDAPSCSDTPCLPSTAVLSISAAALPSTWRAPGARGPSATSTPLAQGTISGVTSIPLPPEEEAQVRSAPAKGLELLQPDEDKLQDTRVSKLPLCSKTHKCVVADVARADLELLLPAAEEALDSCSCSHTRQQKPPNASFLCAV